MDRRLFIKYALLGVSAAVWTGGNRFAFAATGQPDSAAAQPVEKLVKTNEEWQKILTPAQYNVLREEGTERPFSSPLNDEHRSGMFACVACDLPLFPSKFKFDSGTGWPSFYDAIPGHIETKSDTSLFMVRTEYHCARCGGHHGHIFNDGPRPTGLRHCNNGVALKFIPA